MRTGQKGTTQQDENQYTFVIIYGSDLLRTRNVSDKSCTENQNTHFMFNDLCFEFRAIYEKVGKHYSAGQATEDNAAHALCTLDT